MTDKQIVIDGVDVSGCECYNPNIKMDCLLHPLQSDACKNNPNCYYKQLKRKEQECEELKLDLIEAKAHGDYLNNLALSKTLDTVSAELDQFKAEQNKIKTICDNHFDEYEMGCLDLSDAIESLLERYDNAITGLMKQRKELKAKEQECEELNKEIHNLNSTIDFIKVTEHSAINKYNKLKQAVREIKKITEENIRIADLEGLNGVYRRGLAEQILQKCEVINDR